MDEYRSNSNALKNQESKKQEKVVSGAVKVKEKSALGKLRDIFIEEDPSSIRNMVFMDVIVPAIKKVISDIVVNGTAMLLYGTTAKSSGSNTASRVSYSSYYNGGSQPRPVQSGTNRFNFEGFVMESRADAEAVLTRMFETLEQYGAVTVNDFYDFMGVEGAPTDVKYGWRDLRAADVARVRDGYILKLPKVMPLN